MATNGQRKTNKKMTNETQILIDVCRLCGVIENKRPGEADAVFYYPDSKGKQNIHINNGEWYDHRKHDGGQSPVGLVMNIREWDKQMAVDWCRREGIIPDRKESNGRMRSTARRNLNRSKRRNVRGVSKPTTKPVHTKPVPPVEQATNTKPSTTQTAAVKWWSEAMPIPEGNAEHPFRAWARNRNLLHPYCKIPAGIRWHGYRGGVIAAGVFPLHQWDTAGIPTGEPVAIHFVAIDQEGNKAYTLGPDRTDDKRSYGPLNRGVFLIGSPLSERVNIVEGIADALAVYSRVPGVVVASIGSLKTLRSRADVLGWICKKEVWIYADQDNAGDKGTTALAEVVKTKNPDADVFTIDAEAFEDPGQWAEQTPFPDIDRYNFDEKSGMLYDSGVPWTEADRQAIQLLL